jgi:phosphate-selective porin
VSPALFVYRKAVGAYAEYFRTTEAVAKGGPATAVTNTGWNATGVFVLTGEAATDRGATPKRPFDPAQDHWGALQLAIRVSELRVDPQVFALGYAASGASRVARAVGVGLVWYNNANVKHMLTFERTVFDRDAKGPRKAENALVFRVQVSLSPRL